MIGSILGVRYELTGLLADHPLFELYSGRDRVLSKDVSVRVLKRPFAHEETFVQALRTSVSASAVVQSPRIESLMSVEDDESQIFIVGELSRGPSLADRIRKLAPFSVPVSVGTAIAVCQALEPLHRQGLAHGDVSSRNVVVLRDNEVRVQLANLWQAFSQSQSAGAVVHPLMAPYLAPEVSAGQLPSMQSDVYAVGVLLFELLTGRRPFLGESPQATAIQHRDLPVPGVQELNPSVPHALDMLVRKALAKDPSERYSTASALLADLRLIQDALRFGRQLSWPLRGAALSDPEPVPKSVRSKKQAADPQRVAPKMSAIRAEEGADPRRTKERDVPIWMIVCIVALGFFLLGAVGFWMVLNLNKPRLVEVPNVRGLSLTEARALLEDQKLAVRVGQREASETVEVDRVLDVNPEPGQRVREGGQVSVVISAGSRFVEVPDLQGLTVDKARGVLSGLGLELEVMSTAVPSRVAIGDIARQRPVARSRAERQSSVQVFVSSGQDGTAQAIETDSAEYLYTIRVTVSEVPQPVLVRVDLLDSAAPDGRTIYVAQHNAADRFEVEARSRDPKVRFRIFYDDQEVKTTEKSATSTAP